MDRQKVQHCLEQVAAYRASGQKSSVWATANGLEPRELRSWCTHARRWQAKLEGVIAEPKASPKPSGFVAAHVAATTAPTSVRIELNTPATRLDLHWPVAHMRELALLLRELGQ